MFNIDRVFTNFRSVNMISKYILAAIILLSVNNIYSQDLDEYLIAYWSFDDKTVNDHSGNNYHGTLMNNPEFVTGYNGNGLAVRFSGKGEEGSSGSHIVLPMLDFNLYNEFTISLWVYEEALTHPAGEAYIFFGNHNDGWLGLMNHIPDYSGDSYLNLQFATGASYDESIEPLYLTFDYAIRSKWNHYMIIYDKGILKAYKDGKFIGEKNQKIKISGNRAGLGRHWWKWDNESEKTSTRFSGIIDEVKIYSKVLNDDEIIFLNDKCKESSFEYYNFENPDFINLVGDSKLENKKIVLTTSSHRKYGVAWHKLPVTVNSGFETIFRFRISEGNQGTCDDDGSLPGADGLAFVIQNNGPTISGDTDWGIGYDGIPNSIAIEFDMFKNDKIVNDINGNHIAVQSRGKLPNSSIHLSENTLGLSSNILKLEPNGKDYYSKIIYNRIVEKLEIFLSETEAFGDAVLIIENFKIEDYIDLDLDKNAFVGFTASTGDAWERHEILSWYLCSENTCEEFSPEVTSSTGSFGLCSGETIELSTKSSYRKYIWNNNVFSDKFSVNEPGDYNLIVEDKNGCRGYDTLNIEAYPSPNPNLSILETSKCLKDSAVLALEGSFADIIWYKYPENTIISEGSYKITIMEEGRYYCSVMNDFGCIGETDTVDISFTDEKNVLSFRESDRQLINFPHLTIGETNCKIIFIKNEGVNPYQITDAFTKLNISFSVPQSQLPLILDPGEEESLEICFHPDSTGLFNDTLVIEDICSSVNILLTGTAESIFSDSENKCGSKLQFIIDKTNSNNFILFKPFPNPALDQVNINFVKPKVLYDNEFEIRISDVFGKTYEFIGNISIIENNLEYTVGLIEMDISKLVSGLYIFNISTGSESHTVRILK